MGGIQFQETSPFASLNGGRQDWRIYLQAHASKEGLGGGLLGITR
jgi:hypothetical protein